MKQDIYEELFGNLTTGALTIEDVLLNFAAACVLSILIYISYRVSHSGAVYSRKFNVSVVMLTLVTTLVMNVIGNNIALSLGMVGALSIVRFRTAIKDPRDTTYIFWAIAVGICCGVSDYLIAGIGSFIIFIFLILFGTVRSNERMMAVIKSEYDGVDMVAAEVASFFDGKAMLRLQSVSKSAGQAEVIYEISEKLLKAAEKKNGSFLSAFSKKEEIIAVNLVRQDEEINL